MVARAVGGRAALLMLALLACDITPSRSSEPQTPAIEAPSAPLSPPPATPGPPADTVGEPAAVASSEPAERLVFVTIDGARWEDVFAGWSETDRRTPTMPRLQKLVSERGTALGGASCPHDIRASGPNFVSLPGYVEIFTGRPAAGCYTNDCPQVTTDTFIDAARREADSPRDVAVFASWNKYLLAATRDSRDLTLSVGTRPTSLARSDDAKLRSLIEAGGSARAYPGWGSYRPDPHTARLALRYLETVMPRVMVLGLGDADEYAHRGEIASYERALVESDVVIGEIADALSRMGEEGENTAVIVTADHGRARSMGPHGAGYPESQRVFVAAFGAGIARRGVACTKTPLRLSHIAGTVRDLLRLGGPREDATQDNPLSSELLAER